MIVGIAVNLRDLVSVEETGEVSGIEVYDSDANASSGLGSNTKCNLSRGCNPEHHLEDFTAVGCTVVGSTCGT